MNMIYTMYSSKQGQTYCGFCLLLLYVLLSRSIGKWNSGFLLVVSTVIWTVMIVFVYKYLPQLHIAGHSRHTQRSVREYAVMGAVFFLATHYIIGAFLNDLAGSPYDRSISGIVSNLCRVLPPLAMKEIVRAYAIYSFSRLRRKESFFLLTVLVLFITDLNMGKLFLLRDVESIFIYVFQTVMPDLAVNILLTVLVFFGGAGAGIFYVGIVKIFPMVFPVLPDIPWIAQSALGIGFPLLYVLFISERCRSIIANTVDHEGGGIGGFLAALLASVTFLWFSIGVFPVFPSVVLTGSMEPVIYPGDMVLIKKINDEAGIDRLEEGQVINFKRDTITITHRIIAVIRDEAGNVEFQTKGDNNKAADVQCVSPNDVNGIVIGTIPKVGYPILILKSNEELPEGVIDDVE